MSLWETIKTALRDLMLRKFRSGLATLGIMFAVASVLTMIAISEGGRIAVMQRIALLGVDNVIIRSVKPAGDETRQAGQRRRQYVSEFGLKRDDLEYIRDCYPHLRYIVGLKNVRDEVHSDVLSMGVNLPVVATEPDYLKITRSRVTRGRFLHWHDGQNAVQVCVIGKMAARKIFAWEDCLGQVVRIGRDYYEIVGEIENVAGLRDAGGDDINNTIFLPLQTVQRRKGDFSYKAESGSVDYRVVELDGIQMQLDDEQAVIPIAERLKSYLGKTHTKNDYQLTVPLDLINQQAATQRVFTIVMASIAGISLLIGGIGIMNIMLANVSERRKEIGARRALGARRIDIIQQFMVESATLTTLGGIVGLGLGFVLSGVVARYAGWPTHVSTFSILLSLGVSGISGLFFGLWPAYEAAKVNPIEALRAD